MGINDTSEGRTWKFDEFVEIAFPSITLPDFFRDWLRLRFNIEADAQNHRINKDGARRVLSGLAGGLNFLVERIEKAYDLLRIGDDEKSK